jgi:hypothetical protein
MKIDTVGVTYGELRSDGYPNFSNKRIEITLSAKLEQGETPEQAKDRLYDLAKGSVKAKFGDKNPYQSELELPFDDGVPL